MAHIQNAALRGADWHHKGHCGQGNVSGLLDSLSGRTAIVCGNGKGVFEELSWFVDKEFCRKCDKWVGSAHVPPGDSFVPIIFAANDVGVYLPHVDHMVSLHTPRLDHWVGLRRDNTSTGNGNKDIQAHDAGLCGPRDYWQWKALTPLMALSGMFAAQIAYLMGCYPIILCGCPTDDTPRFWETKTVNPVYPNVQNQIRQRMGEMPEFKKAIRSMSGWSKEFFGGV